MNDFITTFIRVIIIIITIYLIFLMSKDSFNNNDYALSSEKVMAAELTQA